jgi:sugar-specific transcriptional regulator TrmB
MISLTETSKKLRSIGLTRDEALVYGHLLEQGAAKSLAIQRATGLTKPLAYRALHELVERGLVLHDKKPGAVALFSPADPRQLRSHILRQRADVELTAQSLESLLPEFSRLYRTTYSKPPIQYYEGPTGIEAVFADLETAQETIYAYIDIDATKHHLPDINTAYAQKRNNSKIYKHVLAVDSPLARAYALTHANEYTRIRFVHTKPFQTSLQIYDGKISYLTIVPSGPLGIIIEDQLLYTMHRELFELLWNQSEPESV